MAKTIYKFSYATYALTKDKYFEVKEQLSEGTYLLECWENFKSTERVVTVSLEADELQRRDLIEVIDYDGVKVLADQIFTGYSNDDYIIK